MTRYPKRFWALAASLAALAGFVDAVGFLKLGGLFVSFMSGNSTRLAVGLADQSEIAAVATGLIASFVAGVVTGTLVVYAAGTLRKAAVLLLVCPLLSVAALLDGAVSGALPAFVMAAGMGAANCVFQRDGEVSIGVTYMTGTLVKLGQHLAAALLGHDRWGWLPYFLLWGGLVAGAIIGASLYPHIGSACLWIASGLAALLATAAYLLGPAEAVKYSATTALPHQDVCRPPA